MPEIINSSQVKIMTEIFKNPGISLRGIIEKTRLSPNYVSEYMNLLVRKGILEEERLEKKRVYLRRFYINYGSKLARNFFVLIKDSEKEIFYKKYWKLRGSFEQMSRIEGIDFLLVYGSYARFAAEKDSDIDLLIAGNIKNKEKIREILISLHIEPSIKIETLKVFKKRSNDALHKQIMKESIIIYDSGKFMNLLFKRAAS